MSQYVLQMLFVLCILFDATLALVKLQSIKPIFVEQVWLRSGLLLWLLHGAVNSQPTPHSKRVS